MVSSVFVGAGVNSCSVPCDTTVGEGFYNAIQLELRYITQLFKDRSYKVIQHIARNLESNTIMDKSLMLSCLS